MRKTAWLVSLCWKLPDEDPMRLRLQKVLLERLDVTCANSVANDVRAPRLLQLVQANYLRDRLRPAG